ncbi:Protein of unknown function DUF3987) [uncultured Caudovirales phage]|uniref:Uncharacterized protein n=1 Tax=uncultured Caudovirales phage TaxID=2100421 RepID=A0A6J5SHS1_9CAUD|nr:Protein of unknown function DUF3987) [uncultured Caudovirales phage]CAB4182551.1 Protein of unknown function DUF3987) [uncultured Caudovirales phage]CAB4214125.1 Protein of unknown function DUF3987) [uncultured Caudovirales phage]CAB5228273.1 Protein of unknown function DUF3987) [uncultured Caudovirales phage]
MSRILIVSDQTAIAPTQQLVGTLYKVIDLQYAFSNEGRREIDDSHVLIWPTATIQALRSGKSLALEIAEDAAEVKFLDTSMAGGDFMTADEFLTMDDGAFPAFREWALGDVDGILRTQIIPKPSNITTGAAQASSPVSSPSVAPLPMLTEPDAAPTFSGLQTSDTARIGEALDAAFEESVEPEFDIPSDAYQDEFSRVSSENVIDIEEKRNSRWQVSVSDVVWTDPLDLSARLYNGLPFQMKWLPPALGDFAEDTAERMGGDCGAVAMGQIGACSACSDDGFYTTPKLKDTGWKERARVWTLAVGLSATKKTWLLESALRAAQDMDAINTIEYHKAMEKFEFAELKYVDERNRAVKNDYKLPERTVEKPVLEHIMLSEFTIESVRDALLGSPRGVGVYRDEFAGLIKDLDRYSNGKGGGDRYSLLELHNGGLKKISRVGNHMTVPNWSASLTGCLTPTSLRSVMGDLAEDGLLQRFLICMVKEAKNDIDRIPDARAAQAYKKTLINLRNMQATSGGHAIPFSKDAYDVRMDFMETANALAKAEAIPGAMAAHIRKWEAQFPRLCLLFHLVDLAVNNQHPGNNEIINGPTAEKVRDILYWQHSHIEQFWLDTLSDVGTEFSQVIASYILTHNIERLSHTDHVAKQHWDKWKKLTTLQKQQTYAALENAGWIQRDPAAKLNTDKVWSKWAVNPLVHKKFVQQAEMERQRRTYFKAKYEERKSAVMQESDHA